MRNERLGDGWSEICALINEMLDPDDQICNETCNHGGGCSLSYGHTGSHETHSSDNTVLCRWES